MAIADSRCEPEKIAGCRAGSMDFGDVRSTRRPDARCRLVSATGNHMRQSLQKCNVVCAAVLLVLTLACDRGVEPFDPDEQPVEPDLARIFPETGERRGGPSGGGIAMPGVPANATSQRGNTAEPSALESAAAGSAPIRGVIELDPALESSVAPGSTLFIITRTQPPPMPPLAVLAVREPSFPHSFEIGQANVMIPGRIFEGEITLSARLDGDGNARTKLPGDLSGTLAIPLAPGATAVRLILNEKR